MPRKYNGLVLKPYQCHFCARRTGRGLSLRPLILLPLRTRDESHPGVSLERVKTEETLGCRDAEEEESQMRRIAHMWEFLQADCP